MKTTENPPAPPGDIYLCPGAAPAGAGGSLLDFVTYCCKMEDFKPEISLYFHLAKTIGGGGKMK